MQFIKAFFQIIRWQNLVFIGITQLLFHYCILLPNLSTIHQTSRIDAFHLFIIILASICIAAGGNIINDYFDLNIDKINKPNKLVIGKYITRRNAIFFHLLFSSFGIYASFYVGHHLNIFWLGMANSAAVLLLFIYSASLKKKFLIGNVVVSLLTSWVIMILCLPEVKFLSQNSKELIDVYDKIFRLGVLYASFSFIISVVREVIKDMEDIDGDRINGCKTLPIVLGINATKTFVAVWLIVLIALLIISQVYVIRFKWWFSIIYCVFLLIFPLIFILKKIFSANTNQQFNILSSNIKWIMLIGIVSMLFFYIYG